MQGDNRLRSEGKTLHFRSVMLKMPIDSPVDRPTSLLDLHAWIRRSGALEKQETCHRGDG